MENGLLYCTKSNLVYDQSTCTSLATTQSVITCSTQEKTWSINNHQPCSCWSHWIGQFIQCLFQKQVLAVLPSACCNQSCPSSHLSFSLHLSLSFSSSLSLPFLSSLEFPRGYMHAEWKKTFVLSFQKILQTNRNLLLSNLYKLNSRTQAQIIHEDYNR